MDFSQGYTWSSSICGLSYFYDTMKIIMPSKPSCWMLETFKLLTSENHHHLTQASILPATR